MYRIFFIYTYVFLCTHLQVELNLQNLEILFFTYTHIIYKVNPIRSVAVCNWLGESANQAKKII